MQDWWGDVIASYGNQVKAVGLTGVGAAGQVANGLTGQSILPASSQSSCKRFPTLHSCIV